MTAEPVILHLDQIVHPSSGVPNWYPCHSTYWIGSGLAGFSRCGVNRTHAGVRDFVHNLPQLSCSSPFFGMHINDPYCMRTHVVQSPVVLPSILSLSLQKKYFFIPKAFVAKQMGALEGLVAIVQVKTSQVATSWRTHQVTSIRSLSFVLWVCEQVIEMPACTTSILWTRLVVLNCLSKIAFSQSGLLGHQ